LNRELKTSLKIEVKSIKIHEISRIEISRARAYAKREHDT
jgi:hypothetical protein